MLEYLTSFKSLRPLQMLDCNIYYALYKSNCFSSCEPFIFIFYVLKYWLLLSSPDQLTLSGMKFFMKFITLLLKAFLSITIDIEDPLFNLRAKDSLPSHHDAAQQYLFHVCFQVQIPYFRQKTTLHFVCIKSCGPLCRCRWTDWNSSVKEAVTEAESSEVDSNKASMNL